MVTREDVEIVRLAVEHAEESVRTLHRRMLEEGVEDSIDAAARATISRLTQTIQ